MHIRTQLVNPSFPRASLCPEGVTVFDSLSEVRKTYVEAALLIPPPGGAEYRPSTEAVVTAQRKRAAAIGANGLIVNRGRHRNHYLYDDALAIFIPDDTLHALSVCHATHDAR
jgi:hypothetical protein